MLYIFILKVCYLKGHFLDSGWRDGRREKSQVKRMRRVKKGSQIHFWMLVLASPFSPNPDRKRLRLVPQIGITCSSTVLTHKNMFSFPLHIISFCFLLLSYTTCPVKSRLTPLDTEGRRGLWQHYKKTTWPFVCVCFLFFVHVCTHMCVYV